MANWFWYLDILFQLTRKKTCFLEPNQTKRQNRATKYLPPMPLIVFIIENGCNSLSLSLSIFWVLDLCQLVTPFPPKPVQFIQSSIFLALNLVFNKALLLLPATFFFHLSLSLSPAHKYCFWSPSKWRYRSLCSQCLLTLYNKYLQHTGCIPLAIHCFWTST